MIGGLEAGASLVGAGAGIWAEMKGAADARRFSAQQVQSQMDFQERMRSTAYQTAVRDMRKAGLNPALAYSQGPAATPSGAAAQGENIMEGLAETGVSSALDMRRLQKEISEADARISQANTQADLNKEAAKTQESVRELQDAQKKAAQANARQTTAMTVPIEIDSNILKKNKWVGYLDAISKRLLPWANKTLKN